MTEAGTSILRRMARAQQRPEPEPGQDTPVRTLRLSMARAAQAMASLTLNVLAVTDDKLDLDDLNERVGADDLVVTLMRDGAVAGLSAIDQELRAALVERQTMGMLLPRKAEVRRATRVDQTLSRPIVDALFADLALKGQETGLADWVEAAETGAVLPSLRDINLRLPNIGYRVVRLTVDLLVGERQGNLLIALPSERHGEADLSSPLALQWRQRLNARVSQAPFPMRAILGRKRMQLSAVEALRVGQIIPLPELGVGTIRLVGKGGAFVAPGRLGQSRGMRAVRVEAHAAPQFAGLVAAESPGFGGALDHQAPVAAARPGRLPKSPILPQQAGGGLPPEGAPTPDAPPEIAPPVDPAPDPMAEMTADDLLAEADFPDFGQIAIDLPDDTG